MKVLFDLIPVALFFVTYKVADLFVPDQGIYYATGVAIVVAIIQIGWLLARRRKIDMMLKVSFGMIVVLGGATLLLHDETFIKWKPTVLYWVFSLGLAISQMGFGKNLIREAMGSQIDLPEVVWTRLCLSWAAFFAFVGAANLYVATHYSRDTWVNFKLFGVMGLMLLFIVGQGLVLSRYVREEEKK
jgi:intracellular septation protein